MTHFSSISSTSYHWHNTWCLFFNQQAQTTPVPPGNVTFPAAGNEGETVVNFTKWGVCEIQKQLTMYFAPTRSFFVVCFCLHDLIEVFFFQLWWELVDTFQEIHLYWGHYSSKDQPLAKKLEKINRNKGTKRSLCPCPHPILFLSFSWFWV